MTTAHKMFTLPVDVIDLLKMETNASKLVTGLLRDHYGQGSDEVEVLKAQFTKAKREASEAEERAKKFFDKYTEIEKMREGSKDLLNKCPALVTSIKKYPKIQMQRDWEKGYNQYITWTEALEIYRIIRGKKYPGDPKG